MNIEKPFREYNERACLLTRMDFKFKTFFVLNLFKS